MALVELSKFPHTSGWDMRERRQKLILAARRAVREAIVTGRLHRIETRVCVDCGNPAQAWEHRDYRKPLDVEPVCHPCNAKRGPGLPWAPRKLMCRSSLLRNSEAQDSATEAFVILCTRDEAQRLRNTAAEQSETVEEYIRRWVLSSTIPVPNVSKAQLQIGVLERQINQIRDDLRSLSVTIRPELGMGL